MEEQHPSDWPTGGGELGALIRTFDWSATGLGRLAGWPQSLKTATDIVLRSPVPLVMLWGPDGIMIYNDAYAVFAGGRHPQLLGSRVREGWAEVADFNDNVMRVGLAGETLAYRDQELTLFRKGHPEQVWMNLDYSPVLDESGQPAGVLAIVIETTERVYAERALRVERDRSRGILDSMAEGFLVFDQDFRVTQANAEALKMDGRAATDILGRVLWDLWPGLQDSEVGDLYRRALREAVPVALEHHYVMPDGREAWFDMRGYPSPDGIALFYRDVTARKRIENALRTSEAQFRAVAQALPNHVWTASADGLLDWFNDRVYEYSGVAPGSLYGENWATLLHPDDARATRQRWIAALSMGTTYEVEFRLRRVDGAYRWHIARAVPIMSAGVVMRWIGTNTDIDDQKAAADALLRLNATLEQRVAERTAERDRVWRNSQDLLVVIDMRGRFRSVNPAATKILGWAPEEMIGLTVFDFIHPDDHAASSGALDVATHGDLPSFVNRYRHRDGSLRWISWVAAPEDNLIYGYGRDITAERSQAEALHQAEEQLRQSQKMEAVGQLTGGVAHDFNNLLTVIRSSIDLLKRPGLSNDRRERYIEAISDTTGRAAKLTGQLLAFARRQALKPAVFDIGRSVEAIGDMVVTLTGSRIRIDTRVPPQSWFVNADPSQFDTAMINLAVNARDAMNGEGTLTVSVSTVREIPALRAHAAITGDYVAVSMTDTGSGIAPDDLDRVFEPFFTTKGIGHGTGLGLSQVFGFVKQSGGEVGVESMLGQGTTFTLYLPRIEGEEPTPDPVGPDRAPIDGYGTCVLVVEDNRDVGSFATQTLEELGYRSVLAVDAEAALVELGTDASRFDVVFSDVVMPGMNGIELGQEIRLRHADLPVVLTSGYSHVLAQTGTHGFELLQKPYSIEDLSRVLQKAAHWRRLKRVLEG